MQITVDVASIVGDSGHGHSGVNAGDIIPPFAMDGYVYSGNNWDDVGQAIWANGCNVPSSTTTTPTTRPNYSLTPREPSTPPLRCGFRRVTTRRAGSRTGREGRRTTPHRAITLRTSDGSGHEVACCTARLRWAGRVTTRRMGDPDGSLETERRLASLKVRFGTTGPV